jgi:hypothetical protein
VGRQQSRNAPPASVAETAAATAAATTAAMAAARWRAAAWGFDGDGGHRAPAPASSAEGARGEEERVASERGKAPALGEVGGGGSAHGRRLRGGSGRVGGGDGAAPRGAQQLRCGQRGSAGVEEETRGGEEERRRGGTRDMERRKRPRAKGCANGRAWCARDRATTAGAPRAPRARDAPPLLLPRVHPAYLCRGRTTASSVLLAADDRRGEAEVVGAPRASRCGADAGGHHDRIEYGAHGEPAAARGVSAAQRGRVNCELGNAPG